ncbi:MAG: hypothetical protein LAO55_04210 [Acidobacteriia bacterium]|jgi:hypothetical protein|nr:hypothetical protein [Terriglobia bacterium]
MRKHGLVGTLAIYASALLLFLLGAMAHHTKRASPAIIRFEPPLRAPRLPVRRAPSADRGRVYWI